MEPLFAAMKHGWGLKDAWQQSRQGLMRWVTILAVGYALAQMLAYTDPARLDGLAEPAPWRPPGTRTAGLIQAGIGRILRAVGLPAFIAAISSDRRSALAESARIASLPRQKPGGGRAMGEHRRAELARAALSRAIPPAISPI